jgi:hypothetical protein
MDESIPLLPKPGNVRLPVVLPRAVVLALVLAAPDRATRLPRLRRGAPVAAVAVDEGGEGGCVHHPPPAGAAGAVSVRICRTLRGRLDDHPVGAARPEVTAPEGLGLVQRRCVDVVCLLSTVAQGCDQHAIPREAPAPKRRTKRHRREQELREVVTRHARLASELARLAKATAELMNGSEESAPELARASVPRDETLQRKRA